MNSTGGISKEPISSTVKHLKAKHLLIGVLSFIGLCGLIELVVVGLIVTLFPFLDSELICMASLIAALSVSPLLFPSFRNKLKRILKYRPYSRTTTCSLPSRDFNARKSEISLKLRPHVRDLTECEGQIEVHFNRSKEVGRLLNDFIEFERTCCSFMKIKKFKRDDALLLQITGSPKALEFVKTELKNIWSTKARL